MRKKKFLRSDYIKIHDKGNQYSTYDIYGRGLVIDSITIKDGKKYYGFIKSWTYALDKNGIETCSGSSQQDLIDFMKKLAASKKVESKSSKEILLIYTDNLLKAKGFLQPIITYGLSDNDNEFYIQVCDTIEIREIVKWTDEYDTAETIAEKASYIIKNVFYPEKYYYLTPNQRPRKKLKKALANHNIAPSLMPQNFRTYAKDRAMIFGGILGAKRKEYTYKMTEGIYLRYDDLTSAYPYVMIAKKHPMEPLHKVDKELHNQYNSDDNYFTKGYYKIDYRCNDNLIATYKDINGNNLEYGYDEVYTAYIRCCDKDILNIIKICDHVDIKCYELYVAKKDYLPIEIIECCIQEFNKKQELKGKGAIYDLQKKVVNGLSGDLTRKPWDNELNFDLVYSDNIDYEKYHEDYKKFRKECIYSIYWGISVTAEIRYLLTDMALKVKAKYCDTDGMIYYAFPENVKIIDDYNTMVKEELASFGYDINGPLGQFKIEADNIELFKAFDSKTYAYWSKNMEKPVIKVAGMKKEQQEKIGLEVFDPNYELDYGYVTVRTVMPETIVLDLDGYTFISEGYYYEVDRNLSDPIDRCKLRIDLIRGKIGD